MRWILALLGVLSPTLAAAQLAGSADVANDYRFRGVSLSAGRPVAQLDAAFDFAGGGYAGLFLSNAQFSREAPRRMQALGYAGYAQRLAGGGSIDAGIAYSAFAGDAEYDYGEIHLGFAAGEWSARISYAPNYFGVSTRTLYGEINAARSLGGQLRGFAHAGALFAASADGSAGHPHADASLGLAWGGKVLTVQMSRVICDGVASIYPVAESSGHGGWVLRVSASF